jgi:antitoxin component of RelBE/YafQ-DinJ toxin-antitoxin module
MRVSVTFSLDADLWSEFRNLSKRMGYTPSRTIDNCLLYFINKWNKRIEESEAKENLEQKERNIN